TKIGKDSSITEALTLANSSRNNLSLLVLDQNGELLPVLEQVEDLSNSIIGILNVDRKLSKNIWTYGNYRIRGIEIGGGDQLLVIADLSVVERERNRNYLLLILFLLISSLLSLSLLRRVIARDVKRAITEIQALDHLRAEQEKNHFLKNFIADASHELRTPLTVIKGYLELWKQNPNSLPDTQRLEIMLAESIRMDKNISSLLGFLEQETTNEETLRLVDIGTILEEELRIFAERESNRKIDKSIEP
ncbi:MAG: histidine kinase dimerization/phospho-acceptor domain-containing protein, partial [Actinomycetales bacterium]